MPFHVDLTAVETTSGIHDTNKRWRTVQPTAGLVTHATTTTVLDDPTAPHDPATLDDPTPPSAGVVA